MINTSNCVIASSPPGNPSAGLKAHFKTPEGRYDLQHEKSHSVGILHQVPLKTITQVTPAPLKDKQAPSSPQSQSSSYSAITGLRSAAAKLLGVANGTKALGYVGGNGVAKAANGAGKAGSLPSPTPSSSSSTSCFEGKGNYVIFNAGDAVFISDLNSPDKDPVKSIHFNNTNPVCLAFDPDARDGHDLIIGMSSGDVYSASLRQQLQDVGRKLVGAQHYNKDGSVNTSRCASVAWVLKGDGAFVVAHTDGNLYVYDKNKDGGGDSTFPAVKDQSQFSVTHARYSKSNPISRWHICQGSINGIAFSMDGTYIAIVGRDGYLRVFDYSKEVLIYGGKSYYGALLCCAWSMDGKYILSGGEDDLVHVWSMEDRKIVAWGEGHNSWVSGVAFDPYWSSPNQDRSAENVYRFGSVGQDAQLLLWDLEMDEIVVPLRRCLPGGSPTSGPGSPTNNIVVEGALQPAPRMQDVPKLSPLVSHVVHIDSLSGLIFTRKSIVTACRDGILKVWARPGYSEKKSSVSDRIWSSNVNDTAILTGKVSNTGFKQIS